MRRGDDEEEELRVESSKKCGGAVFLQCGRASDLPHHFFMTHFSFLTTTIGICYHYNWELLGRTMAIGGLPYDGRRVVYYR